MAKHSSTFTGSETAANLNSGNAKTVTVKAKWKSNCTENCSDIDLSVNESVGFSYTGTVKGVTLKKSGRYKLEVWGAQGGTNTVVSRIGGYGGYSFGEINLSDNDSIYLVIGGQPSYCGTCKFAEAGGYNGGGQGGYDQGAGVYGGPGASGGGATHIATVSGVLSSLSSSVNQAKVLIVAGGGGGGSGGQAASGNGASGGGMEGGTATTTSYTSYTMYGGGGGTQSSGGNAGSGASGYTCPMPGSFGLGGSVCGYTTSETGSRSGHEGGGGGGWFGGGTGGGSWYAAEGGSGGGGGSGYIGNSLLTNKGMYQYSTGCTSSTATATKTTCTSNTGAHVANVANTGNGYAKITYLGT